MAIVILVQNHPQQIVELHSTYANFQAYYFAALASNEIKSGGLRQVNIYAADQFRFTDSLSTNDIRLLLNSIKPDGSLEIITNNTAKKVTKERQLFSAPRFNSSSTFRFPFLGSRKFQLFHIVKM